jgi:hypothetical protein
LNSFDFNFDSDGDEYVLIKHRTQQKNIEGGITSEETPNDKFIYASRTNTCPLASLRLHINKTDPKAKSLFNRCVKDLRAQYSVWYTNQPLPMRTYSGFMTDICKNAKCSKVCTAHCLRATSIQAMNDAGQELRHIMLMTGHKNEASIRSCNWHCSVQKSLSSTLSRIAMGEDMSSNDQLQNKENAVVPTNSRAITHSNKPALPSSSSQQRDTIAPSSMQIPSLV